MIFLRSQNFSFKIFRVISVKISLKISWYVWNVKKNTEKEVKMHNFLVCAYKFQDFAQNLKKIAQSYDRETVTFRNSGYRFLDKNPKYFWLTNKLFFLNTPLQIMMLFHLRPSPRKLKTWHTYIAGLNKVGPKLLMNTYEKQGQGNHCRAPGVKYED